MTQNLRLPICPKCNDTKHVAEVETATLAVKFGPHHCCTKCNVEWLSNPFISKIIDEHGYVHCFYDDS